MPKLPSWRRPGPLIALFGILLLVLYLSAGSTEWMTFARLWNALLSGPDALHGSPDQVLFWHLRLPRAVAAILVGASLGSAGAAFQALFRNPLADPYVIGVSSGAAVGGALATVFGLATALGGLALVAFAFASAIATLVLVFALARAGATLNVSSLLLAGVTVGACLWAVITLILVLAGQDAVQVLSWLLGDLRATNWLHVATISVVFIGSFFVLLSTARSLDVFALGEESATTLGVDAERLKRKVLISGACMTSAAVSIVGIVGFVGLFVPHIVRTIAGSRVSRVMPLSALAGACALLLADLAAQRVVPDREINVGVVTALVGAPFLFIALRKRNSS
ncbi:iron ABC transporter permease [Fimbriimonadia bacterium ATM]|nr:MAG: iron ABC transporter permease [Armatimonadota bacterium]MBC6969871.1 iron ABC transporter permease [Armatimonadota bacterium]MCE7900355.1 iron ABC transporter permease [Armatimonadetes bacterium ATM1]MDL1928509.1 iron ABC transporter permease [Fimbriimonadia bacterium ATM]RIJ95612.1 MAG: iron ABC transporter [Armatimonadota bacterium]